MWHPLNVAAGSFRPSHEVVESSGRDEDVDEAVMSGPLLLCRGVVLGEGGSEPAVYLRPKPSLLSELGIVLPPGTLSVLRRFTLGEASARFTCTSRPSYFYVKLKSFILYTNIIKLLKHQAELSSEGP